jgi:DNA-binding transcriptional MerR regulator
MLRMRDVTARTGLSRQAIHFYVEEGLVPPPRKTGATTAAYTEAHVERILLVKKLQHEHFLPLKAIRAMLDERATDDDFSPAQQEVLREVKARLPARHTTPDDQPTVRLAELLGRLGAAGIALPRAEVTELERAELVRVVRGRVSPDHAWLIELWAQVRALGFSRALGFGPELLLLFERGIDRMFRDERDVLARMSAALPATEVAAMVERVLPLINAYLVRLHEVRVRALFAGLEATP